MKKLVYIKAIGLLIGFLSSYIIAYFYDKEDFGLYGVLLSLYVVFYLVSSLGLNYYSLKNLPKLSGNDRKYEISSIWSKYLFYQAVFSPLLLVLFYGWLANRLSIEETDAIVAVVGFLFYGFNQQLIYNNRGLGRSKFSLAVESSGINSILIVCVLVSQIVFPGVSIVLLFVVSICANTAILFFFSRASFFIRAEEFKYVSRIGLLMPFWMLSVLEIFNSKLDVLVVNQFLGLESAAEYFFSKKIVVAFSVLWFVFNYKSVTVLSKAFDRNGKLVALDSIRNLMRLKNRILIATAIPALFAPFFYADVLKFIGLERYLGSFDVFMVFLFMLILNIGLGPVVSLLNVSGLSSITPRIVAIGVVIFGISVVPLIYKFGAAGVAVSTMISLITFKGVGNIVIHRRYKFNLIW